MLQMGQFHSMMLRLSVWYALLYVVVEGYTELRHKDPALEELLAQTHMVDGLKRFRNAVFHYQKNPLSEKLLTFLETEESETLIGQLNRAFRSYFERMLPLRDTLSRASKWRSHSDLLHYFENNSPPQIGSEG